ncbi:MAG: helix-turn-helix domain-containing protein [Planctomycetota bacterium]|nr:helix-turn-helix domain-containing protein [Planctomycetota bacterium]
MHGGGTTRPRAAHAGFTSARQSGAFRCRSRARMPSAPGAPAPLSAGDDGEILTMDEEEKKILLRALAVTGGNISEAARRLGLHRSTLHRKMSRFGLATEEDPGAEPEP